MDGSRVPTGKWPASLWAHTAPKMPDNPALEGDITADVTVIGAGFTGLRAALALTEAGSRVVVLDAGDVGWGASGRTGGQVNPMMPFNAPSRIRELVGAATFERLAETSLKSADELFTLIKTYQIDCQARQKGWLRVAHGPKAMRKARADIKGWNDLGAEMEVIGSDEVRSLSGSPAYQGGVVNPRGGAIHPLMYARGLAAAVQARGAQIFGGSPVTDLSQTEAGWIATTPKGAVRSEWVIVATNGYSDDLIPNLDRTVIPITPIQIATDPLPDEVIDTILPKGHTISDSRRVIMYARREPDNRMVYGGHGTSDSQGNLSGFDWLVRDAERVFPQLKGAKWTHRWGGRIAITDDHMPHLHEPAKGLLAGLGYNGRGVAMSNIVGRIMAERALGAAHDTLPLPVTTVTPIPMRQLKVFGLPWVVRGMKMLDRWETR